MALIKEFDPEHLVVEAIRGGDRHAFEEWVHRHGPWVRAVIFGVLGDSDRVDDVAQQVWMAVWQHIGELRDASRWRPWLYRLAKNAATDAGREVTRRRRWSTPLTDSVPQATSTASSDREAVNDEQHREVMAAIESLPALYREPFVLRHLNGWSYQEISDVMDMPADTVETRLVRARRILREALKNKLG